MMACEIEKEKKENKNKGGNEIKDSLEQDVQLFERLAFMARREQRGN